MIHPTIGRIVWVERRPGQIDSGQSEPAIVCYVWSDRLINVAGYNSNGQAFSLTSLSLLQDDDQPNVVGSYARWMPYQKEAQARFEANKP